MIPPQSLPVSLQRSLMRECSTAETALTSGEAEGGCGLARCPLPGAVSVPRHTVFCCTHIIQVTSTSRPSYGMVEARRLVTAGHGPFTSGRPVRGHAGHGQSRRCRSGHGRHGVGPAARPPTARHFAHGSLASRSEGDRSAGHGSPRTLVAAPLRPRRCRRDLDATLRSRRRSKKSSGPRGHTLFAAGQ
jgi:hypothetical protein